MRKKVACPLFYDVRFSPFFMACKNCIMLRPRGSAMSLNPSLWHYDSSFMVTHNGVSSRMGANRTVDFDSDVYWFCYGGLMDR